MWSSTSASLTYSLLCMEDRWNVPVPGEAIKFRRAQQEAPRQNQIATGGQLCSFRHRMAFLAFLQSRPGRVLRAVISVGALGVLVALADWRDLARLAPQVEWSLAALALALTLSSYPACAWRWWYLMRAQGIGFPFRRAHAITWIGQFYNAFLPGGIGGDLTRLVYAFTDDPGKKARAAVAIVADRIIGFGVLLILAVPLALLHAAKLDLRISGVSIEAWLAACAMCAAFGAWGLFRWLAPKLPPGLRDGLQTFVTSPGANTRAACISVAVWLLDFAGGWCLAQSLGLPLSFADMSLALTVAYLSTALPISIGGHGVREGALVLTLGALQVSASMAQLTQLALAFWAVNALCSLAGGLALFTAPPSARR